ncbi:MAG TPA: hypothetical protein VED87_12250 [Methylocystis sp.]|nr:hypothetical protein [Methylocystis sp.]
MTKLLDRAIAKARALPDAEQDAIAASILEELEEDRKWDQAFAASADALSRMAEEALAEDLAGKTLPLNPEKL